MHKRYMASTPKNQHPPALQRMLRRRSDPELRSSRRNMQCRVLLRCCHGQRSHCRTPSTESSPLLSMCLLGNCRMRSPGCSPHPQCREGTQYIPWSQPHSHGRQGTPHSQWMDQSPDRPNPLHSLGTPSILGRSGSLQDRRSRLHHMVSLGPGRCHGTQMDSAYKQSPRKPRNTPPRKPSTL